MAEKQFPEWAKTLYRGVRAGVAAGLSAAWAVRPDWTKPEDSLRVVGAAFIAGFLVAFGKWGREKLDEWFGFDEKSVLAKIMPV